jgi:hypothetical protein
MRCGKRCFEVRLALVFAAGGAVRWFAYDVIRSLW